MSSTLLLLFVILATGQSVIADYTIEIAILTFDHPANTLFNGECCGGNSPCVVPCDQTFRVCFRESDHHHDDEQDCDDPLLTIEEVSSSLQPTEVFEKYYQGAFQVYIKVESRTGIDPLIDHVFIEAQVPSSLYRQPNFDHRVVSGRGELQNTSISLMLVVRCAENYFGEACERLCRPDGTECRTIYIGRLVYTGYNISVTDSLVVGAVILVVLGVLVCIIGDHICNRKSRGTDTAAVTTSKEDSTAQT